MSDSRVLVVGATGLLGRVIVRQLSAAGARVRALGRKKDVLAQLPKDAEIAEVDLRDVSALTEACRGVEQIVATANNNMGKGADSPTRIDLSCYQNLCAASAQYRRSPPRLRLVPRRHTGCPGRYLPREVVHQRTAIRRSGVPHVMLRPTAFMDIWIDEILAKGIREKGATPILRR